MRGKAAAVLRFLGSLAILGGLVVGLGAGLRALFHYLFSGVSPTVAAAIVAAVATGLLSLATLVMQRRYERAKTIEQEIRERKISVYTDLLNKFFDIFGLGENRTEEESAAAIEKAVLGLAKLTPTVIAWSSDPVLLAWSRYRRNMAKLPPMAQTLMFEQFLFSIRADLGHSNKDFKPGDLLALWINDIDDFLAGTADATEPSAGTR